MSRINRSNLCRSNENFGAVAQLVAHLHGMQGVRGSSPLSSTGYPPEPQGSGGFFVSWSVVSGPVVPVSGTGTKGFSSDSHPASLCIKLVGLLRQGIILSGAGVRGCGAAGSAPAWHAGGQGFESPQLH